VVKITAFAKKFNRNGLKINPNTISYRWSQNGEYRHLASQSGYGRNSVLMYADAAKTKFYINVETNSLLEGNVKGTGASLIKSLYPQVSFYKEDPLGGINYEQAVSGKIDHQAGTDLHLVAEPYFISPKNRMHQSIDYRWMLDGRTLRSEELPNKAEVLLVSQAGHKGNARLSVSVSNTEKKFQATKASLVINVTE
jgi:hypothetical protein